MKNFNGKAIYNPNGKAGEYAKWACDFYLKGVMGGDVPTLKKCFKNEQHALEIFEKELLANLPELQKYGLFFSFTTDPMLPETINLTGSAHRICANNMVL